MQKSMYCNYVLIWHLNVKLIQNKKQKAFDRSIGIDVHVTCGFFLFKFTQDCVQSSKLHLTQFTQGLDVNLVQANLSDLIPLFADSSTSSVKAKHDSPKVEGDNSALPNTGHVEFKSDGIFSDKSLFDDGMVEPGNNVEHESVMETNQMTEKESEDFKARPVPCSQDSTDTGFSESQPKEEIGKVWRSQGNGERKEDSTEKGRKFARKKPSNGKKLYSVIFTIADSEN